MIKSIEKQKFKNKIETSRLILTPNDLANAEEVFNQIEKNRSRLSPFIPWESRIKTLDDVKSRFEREQIWRDKFEVFEFGIYLKSTSEYVGNIGVFRIEWLDNKCELGYWLTSDFEGKGYMLEAAEALLLEVKQIGFHRVEIKCAPENIKSLNLAKKLNFTLEGILKDNFIFNGQYQDTMVFAKLFS